MEKKLKMEIIHQNAAGIDTLAVPSDQKATL